MGLAVYFFACRCIGVTTASLTPLRCYIRTLILQCSWRCDAAQYYYCLLALEGAAAFCTCAAIGVQQAEPAGSNKQT